MEVTNAKRIMRDIICPHCILMEGRGLSHSKKCNCSHHHALHNFGGGCTVVINDKATRIGSNNEVIVYKEYCHCDRYDQTEVKVSTPKEEELDEVVADLQELTSASRIMEIPTPD
jgi:hypothetical protein